MLLDELLDVRERLKRTQDRGGNCGDATSLCVVNPRGRDTRELRQLQGTKVKALSHFNERAAVHGSSSGDSACNATSPYPKRLVLAENQTAVFWDVVLRNNGEKTATSGFLLLAL